MEADRQATLAVSRMVNGTGGRKGLRSAVGSSVELQTISDGWNLSYVGYGSQTNRVEYRSGARTLTLQPGGVRLGTNVVQATVSQMVGRADISVRVGLNEGRFSATNEVRTRVRWRN